MSLFSMLCLTVLFCHSVVRASNNGHYPSVSSSIPEKPQKVMNPVDSCWRLKPDWATNRKRLADCAIGFGASAVGGKNGQIYVVTNPSDNAREPQPGSLRYGVIQEKPLWIIFAMDMRITLENELLVNSYKTIDGRGALVRIGYGPCITIQDVTNVIVHGIYIHDCEPGNYGMVRSSTMHIGHRTGSDGDAISISRSSNIWIDHCHLERCTDGLIDVTHASTGVTISNNYFANHVKVMLLGHNDNFVKDVNMKVTVAFNHFGPGLVERMPRVRRGYAHVANNMYDKWIMYAIGGSGDPTIFSEGNYFIASDNSNSKEVTKREVKGGWKNWKWRTSKDVFKNGAYFVPSGYGTIEPPYTSAQQFVVASGNMVPYLTAQAGPLGCDVNSPCY